MANKEAQHMLKAKIEQLEVEIGKFEGILYNMRAEAAIVQLKIESLKSSLGSVTDSLSTLVYYDS